MTVVRSESWACTVSEGVLDMLSLLRGGLQDQPVISQWFTSSQPSRCFFTIPPHTHKTPTCQQCESPSQLHLFTFLSNDKPLTLRPQLPKSHNKQLTLGVSMNSRNAAGVYDATLQCQEGLPVTTEGYSKEGHSLARGEHTKMVWEQSLCWPSESQGLPRVCFVQMPQP